MNVTCFLQLVFASTILLGEDVTLVAFAALDTAGRQYRKPLGRCFFRLQFGHKKTTFRFVTKDGGV